MMSRPHLLKLLICAATPAITWLCAAAAGQHSTIQLPETLPLERLVDLCAERLDLSIEYDTKLSGTVTIRLRSELSDTELWHLTNRLLAARGFTTVQMGRDGTMSVVSLSGAAALAVLETREELSESAEVGSPGFRAVLASVSNRSVEDVVAALKPLLSANGGAVTGLPASNAVIVADLIPRLQLALRALDALEDDATDAIPTEVPVLHLGASRLIALLNQVETTRGAAGSRKLRGQLLATPDDQTIVIIAPASDEASWRALIRRFDQREARETFSYTTPAFGTKDVAVSIENLFGGGDSGLLVVADELTGLLRVTATAAQHEQVRDLLSGLSAAPDAARRPTRKFVLKNRDAQEVLGVVQSLVSAGFVAQQPGAEASARSGFESKAPSAHGSTPADLRLTADPATNSIIAIGEARELERLAALLSDLDVRRPQVLLEVLIVSLSESDSLDLGIEMEKLIIGPGDTIAKLSSLFGLSSTSAAGSGIGDRGSGGSAIVLSPGDFSVVLRALRAVNQGRSLSMPKVLVASNEQASINSVLETPFTEINASDSVATTSYGGSSNAGTEVSVTPQIAEGDHLRLEYQVSLSAFVGEAIDSSVPPPKQQNSINSVATIPDGFTIAVGGIELITEGEAEAGIPVVSDIPLVGEAFKNRSRSASRARFYVFIRPTILRNRSFEDLRYLSEAMVAESGVSDGWPVPEPRLIR